MTHPSRPTRLLRALPLTLTFAALLAAPAARSADTITVPRSEFEQMKRDMAAMRQELNQLKTDRAMAPKLSTDAPRGTTAGAIALLNQRVDDLASAAELSRPGETKMHLGGGASATYYLSDAGDSTFNADFEPVFLWQLNRDLLFEAKVRFSLTDDDTDTDLRYAHLDWSLGDYVTLVAGKFMSPINTFAERYEASWINKLSDRPQAFYSLLPETNVGLQARAVVPIAGPTKLTLAAFVGNSPTAQFIGTYSYLDFDNFDNFSDHKSFGGRVGLQLCPNFEIGYGIQSSRLENEYTDYPSYISPSFLTYGSSSYIEYPRDPIQAVLHSVDLQTSFAALKGRFTLLAQYAWANTDAYSVTRVYPEQVFGGFYDPFFSYSFSGFVIPERRYTTRFNDHRGGGYAQLSYRGEKFASNFLNRLEVIVRGEHLDSPYADMDEGQVDSLTFGLDYWVTPSTVVKTSYEISRIDTFSGDEDFGTFTFGIATGL